MLPLQLSNSHRIHAAALPQHVDLRITRGRLVQQPGQTLADLFADHPSVSLVMRAQHCSNSNQ